MAALHVSRIGTCAGNAMDVACAVSGGAGLLVLS